MAILTSSFWLTATREVTMEKLISELLDLPERVRKGDFVLILSKGVTEPEKTLEQYVVTPQLADCFDDALDFIRSAVEASAARRATCTAVSAQASRTSWRCCT